MPFRSRNSIHSTIYIRSDKINSNSLSAKALGILFYITSTETRISAENLASIFGEGEKAIGTGLKELRDRGLTELRYERIEGKPIKFTVVTKLGWETIADFLRMPSPSSPYVFQTSRNPQNGGIDTVNEQLSKLILNIYKYKPNTFREEETVIRSEVNTRESHESTYPNCIREISPLEQRLQNERVKQATYDERQSIKHRAAIEKRQGRPHATWSISDVCMEIADRAASIWSLPPWRLSSSRLIAAFTQLRRKWGTNGEIEMHAFDFFMKRINTNEYSSVDALWQSFVYQFPEILPKVRAIFPSAEELAAREASREISNRKLREFLRESDSGPSKEEILAKNSEIKRIKSMIHHFQVMEDSCPTETESTEALRYRKTKFKFELDLAIMQKDELDIARLKNRIVDLSDVEYIPEGQYSA